MKIFKLHPDMDARHYPLTKEIYLEMTSRMPPYVMLESDGKMRHYAVCPACNNPVQIIGLHQQKVERAIYAKHIPKTIPRLATYRQAAYENCPLAAKSRIQAEKSARKSGNDDLAPQILHIIFRKRIVFDYDSFQYLLNIPEGKGKRREDLLTIAHQILQQAG